MEQEITNAVTTVDEFFENLNTYFESSDGRSVAEVAAEVGITRQHLYEIKRRTSMPSFSLAVKLTKAMGGSIRFEWG